MPRRSALVLVRYPRAAGLALACVVALGPTAAHAAAPTSLGGGPSEAQLVPEPAPAPEPTPATLDPDAPALALSRAHFKSGLVGYSNGNYERAIIQWTQAHTLLASVPELIGPRHVIGLDLGQAHLRAYDSDHDLAHLAIARGLLRAYLGWVDRPEHLLTATEREDRPRALEMLARIDAEDPIPPPRPLVMPGSQGRGPRAASRPFTSRDTARGMIIGGSSTLAVAAVTAIAAAGLSVQANQPFASEPARASMVAMACFSVITLTVGAPLLAAGLVARRQHLSVAPTLSRSYAGASVGLRF